MRTGDNVSGCVTRSNDLEFKPGQYDRSVPVNSEVYKGGPRAGNRARYIIQKKSAAEFYGK